MAFVSQLPPPQKKEPSPSAIAVRDAGLWFALAVGSLAVAGCFSLVLVIGRVPVLAPAFIRDAEFARRSLVVHVNLAIGVWFLAFLAGLFCLLPGGRRIRTAPLAAAVAAVGVICFIVPTFFESATPILSNYVPALDHRLFLAGLAIFAAGVLLNFADPRLLTFRSNGVIPADAHYAILAAAAAFGVAMLTMAGAWVSQSPGMTAADYYERLFWGGGHVLQTVNTLGMLGAWLILLHRLTGKATIPPRVAGVLMLIMLLPMLLGPWLTLGGYSDRWFTRMMQYGLAPVAIIVLLCGLSALWRRRASLAAGSLRSAAFVGLATSGVMTVVGFILGAMIMADTTLIPAHYHANIGAVTVAYMAVLLTLLPCLGAAPAPPRLAGWQPLLYGVGQMMFVAGLAIAGTLGQASRKVYGQETPAGATAEWVGLIIVGIGGIIALAGGIVFMAIVTSAALRGRHRLSVTAFGERRRG